MALAPAPAPPPGENKNDSNSGSVLTSPGPFEGPEKLLEVWFAPSPDSLPISQASSNGHGNANGHGNGNGNGESSRGAGYRGLRTVPRAVWEEMLDIVKCKVLSVVEGDEVDAYLLRYVSCFSSSLGELLYGLAASRAFSEGDQGKVTRPPHINHGPGF